MAITKRSERDTGSDKEGVVRSKRQGNVSPEKYFLLDSSISDLKHMACIAATLMEAFTREELAMKSGSTAYTFEEAYDHLEHIRDQMVFAIYETSNKAEDLNRLMESGGAPGLMAHQLP